MRAAPTSALADRVRQANQKGLAEREAAAAEIARATSARAARQLHERQDALAYAARWLEESLATAALKAGREGHASVRVTEVQAVAAHRLGLKVEDEYGSPITSSCADPVKAYLDGTRFDDHSGSTWEVRL